MSHTVETFALDANPNYRARIVLDFDSEAPEDEGGSPILVMTYCAVGHVKGRGDHSQTYAVERAARHWHQRGDFDKLERYLRIFHGATDVVTYDTGDAKYVSYDAAEWREKVGAPAKTDPRYDADYSPADMSEYVAYLEGECYGIVIEKLERWYKASSVSESPEPDDWEARSDWEEVESVWGFYGDVDGYVTETAREMLESAAE